MESRKIVFTVALVAGATFWQMVWDPMGVASFYSGRAGIPFVSTSYPGGNPVRALSAVTPGKWGALNQKFEKPTSPQPIAITATSPKLHKPASGAAPAIKVAASTRCVAQYAKDYEAMLAASVQANDLECIQHALNEGAQIGFRDGNGDSLLHIASRAGNLELATSLIEKGIDVSAQANDRSTALHWAAQAGNVQMAQLLMRDGGANPNVLNADQLTPLDLATNFQVGTESPMALLLSEFGGARGVEIGGAAPRSPTSNGHGAAQQPSRPSPNDYYPEEQDAAAGIFPLPPGNHGEIVDSG